MTVLAVALVIGLGVMAAVVTLALHQPRLGLEFEPAPDGKGIVVIEASGPSAHIPVGTHVKRVETGATTMELEPFDLTIEPDGVIPDYKTYQRFIARQDRLAQFQKAANLQLVSDNGQVFRVKPDPNGRPLATLPPDFWIGLAVGLIAWLVSAAVFAFRPGDAGARYLLLSGLATLMFAPAAAIYSTRELAIDGSIFRWASDLNFFGGSLFTASFVALLLHYPRRLAPTWVGLAVVALFVVWFILQQLNVFHSMILARRLLVMVGVFATFVLAGVHWFRTRRDPVARAALHWFLLSWLLGTSLFVLFILLPQTFGIDTTSAQGYAFLLFLLVYGGLAFGILRYRLFDLGEWWRRIAVWTASVLTFILLDLFFLVGLQLSSQASLGWALFICGVVWLPFRAWLWQRFNAKQESGRSDLFARVMGVALAPTGSGIQTSRWSDLLASIFDPLHIAPSNDAFSTVEIQRDGLALFVPTVGSIPAVRMEFARAGRVLFAPRDARLVSELLTMLGHGITSRSAFENGVSEERSRIARDIHDNIGAQLLGALHSRDAATKDSKIREILVDLRGVINDAGIEHLAIDEVFAQLRVETTERLSAAGITCRWASDRNEIHTLDPVVGHALRSVVREAVSNAIRHSGARKVAIAITGGDGSLSVEINDDGAGFDLISVTPGNGLSNMRTRLERLGASLELENTGSGTRIAARVSTIHNAL